ncbi:hypothetical protein E2320_007521, partial [Naja naja]
GEPKDLVKPVPIASPAVPKVSSTTSVAFNKAPRPFGAVSSSKVTSIPSPSSAFTPASSSLPTHASPTPLATVTPPTFTASGAHANVKANADQRCPVLSAANTPWQSPHNATLSERAPEVTEGQRSGSRENQGDSNQQNGPPRKHVVYRNTEFFHPPVHSNNSKKRLIEDTEDWHPRTGTTQSRSFRILQQITGTELKESESDNLKKAKEKIPLHIIGPRYTKLHLMNGLEAQHSHSEATQICEIPEEFQQSAPPPPLLPPPQQPQRAEANSTSPVTIEPALTTISSTTLSGPNLTSPSFRRELFINNPLEALPKCAPHPPVTIHILSINSQVATVSRRLKTRSSELIAPVPKLGTNEAEHKKNLPVMSTVGTQTFEPLVLSLASVESTSTAQPEKSTLEPPFTGRKLLLENPLGSCLTHPQMPFTSVPVEATTHVRSSAAVAVSAAVSMRSRLPDFSSYRSLLDALLITPIIKPPLLESTRPPRKSTSVLEVQRKWSTEEKTTYLFTYLLTYLLTLLTSLPPSLLLPNFLPNFLLSFLYPSSLPSSLLNLPSLQFSFFPPSTPLRSSLPDDPSLIPILPSGLPSSGLPSSSPSTIHPSPSSFLPHSSSNSRLPSSLPPTLPFFPPNFLPSHSHILPSLIPYPSISSSLYFLSYFLTS